MQRVSAVLNRGLPLRKRGGRHGSRGWDWFQKAVDARKKPSAKPHALHYAPLAADHKRPKVFFDFETQEQGNIGSIVFELADDVVPKTVSNFVRLCEGKSEKEGLSYEGSEIHFVKKDFIVQGGNVTRDSDDSRGGHSSFETRYFEDENFILQHGERGVLSMANSGVDRNSSQFFITLAPQQQLDGRNVSFGRIIEGADVLEKIEDAFTVDLKPLSPIVIKKCGLVTENE